MAANKEKAPYSVVSYFCGCGGLDLGFRGGFKYHEEDYPMLPFNILEAYDNEPRCIETYNDYFGAGHAFVKDLVTVKPEEVSKADILIGGFPCQDYPEKMNIPKFYESTSKNWHFGVKTSG